MQSKYEMGNSGWCTKKDVLQDLARANGRKVTNLNNNFFIVGENPPPPPLFSDGENKILHSRILRTNDNNIIKPDLRGITRMLRLVKEYSGSKENVVNASMGGSRSPKSFCDIISISKLNPNVKEFIPKCSTLAFVDPNKDKATEDSQAQVKSSKVHCVGSNEAPISDCQSSIEDVKHLPIENVVNDVVINENEHSVETNVNKNSELESSINVKSNDEHAIATVLKDKITHINASKRTTFQAKKERNVALANLQKLYSVQTNENISGDAEQPVKKVIKLITPDFFEKSLAADNDILENKQENELQITHSTIESNDKPIIAKCQDLTIVKEKDGCSVETIDCTSKSNETGCPLNLKILSVIRIAEGKMKEENMSSDSETNSGSCCTMKSNTSDPQIQDSIKKVKNWFSKADKKPRGPAVYLGPVSFKRKDFTNRQSPNEVDKKISKPNLTVTQQYVPTQYASELNRKYEERIRHKELQKEKITWENLNTKLIEKDEEIQRKSKDFFVASNSAQNISKADDDT